MAKYSVNKEYVRDVCYRSLPQISEQCQQKLKEYNNLPWYKKSNNKELTVKAYKLNDSLFCERHLKGCTFSEGTTVIMDEIEISKLRELWEEYVYDLKK